MVQSVSNFFRSKFCPQANRHSDKTLCHLTLSFVIFCFGLVYLCGHCKPRAATMTTFSLVATLEVVVMTTSGAANDDKVAIMVILGFQWLQ